MAHAILVTKETETGHECPEVSVQLGTLLATGMWGSVRKAKVT